MARMDQAKGAPSEVVKEVPGTSGTLEPMLQDLRQLAASGVGIKVERIPSDAAIPAVAAVPTTEKPVSLGAIDFGKQTNRELTAVQCQTILTELKGIDPQDVVEYRLLIRGGKAGGPATLARIGEIEEVLEAALGRRPVADPTLIPAAPGSDLHVLKPELLVTLRAGEDRERAHSAAPKVSGARGRAGASAFTFSAGVSTDGAEVHGEKDGSDWDLRAALGFSGSSVTVAATHPVGSADLGRIDGKEATLDLRAGPYLKLAGAGQSNDYLYGETSTGPAIEAGGEVIAGMDRGNVQPFIGIRAGVSGDGVKTGVTAGFTVKLGKKED